MHDSKRILYEQLILDHNKNPRNFHELDDSTVHQKGYNALCGDAFDVYLKMDGDTIVDASFKGKGCAISKSSASIMISGLKGKSKKEAKRLFDVFIELVNSKPETPVKHDELGDLAAFNGIREYPLRIKCATLPWHTLMAAIEGETDIISTE